MWRRSSTLSCSIIESSSRRCSSGSVSRTPPITTWRSDSGGSSVASSRITCRARPVATATGMPPSEPLRVVSGVLKSGCASSHSIPTRSASVVGRRPLQSGDEAGHRRTGRQQADGEVAVALVAGDQVGEVPERHAELLPAAVFRLLLRGEAGLVDPDGGAQLGQDLLDAALGHGGRPLGRAVGRQWLLGQRDAQRAVGRDVAAGERLGGPGRRAHRRGHGERHEPRRSGHGGATFR